MEKKGRESVLDKSHKQMDGLKTDEEARLLQAKFHKFDIKSCIGVYWGELGPVSIRVNWNADAQGWLFYKLNGAEADFQHFLGNRKDPSMLLSPLGEPDDPLRDIRDMCKSEFLDNRQEGYRLLEQFLKPLRLGELLSPGMSESDEKIKHIVGNIVISVLSGN